MHWEHSIFTLYFLAYSSKKLKTFRCHLNNISFISNTPPGMLLLCSVIQPCCIPGMAHEVLSAQRCLSVCCKHSMKGSGKPLRRYIKTMQPSVWTTGRGSRTPGFFSCVCHRLLMWLLSEKSLISLWLFHLLQTGLRTLMLSIVLKMMCQLFRWVLCTWHH